MNPGVVAYIEDEEDDVYLLRHVFKEAGIPNPILSLPDGEAAIDYLKGVGPYSNREEYPLPVLLLLDINLPLVSGLDVLEWVRSQPAVAHLPTLMLTSSSQTPDVRRAYQSGANAYLVKPSGLVNLLALAKSIHEFWLVRNQAPPGFEIPYCPEAKELQLES